MRIACIFCLPDGWSNKAVFQEVYPDLHFRCCRSGLYGSDMVHLCRISQSGIFGQHTGKHGTWTVLPWGRHYELLYGFCRCVYPDGKTAASAEKPCVSVKTGKQKGLPEQSEKLKRTTRLNYVFNEFKVFIIIIFKYFFTFNHICLEQIVFCIIKTSCFKKTFSYTQQDKWIAYAIRTF